MLRAVARRRETLCLLPAPWQEGAMPPDATPLRRAPNPAGVRELTPEYDGFILDLWGVLHDGFKPFPCVIDALERLIAAGKRLCVLSNPPPPAAAVVQRMTEIGLPPRLSPPV